VLIVGLVADSLPEVCKEMEKRAKKAQKLADKKSKASKGAAAPAASAEALALNVPAFIHDVLLPDMQPSAANPMIRARAIWCGCEYAESVPSELQEPILHMVVQAMTSDQPLPVRLSAARGFGELVCSFPEDLTQPLLPAALQCLCQLLPDAQEDTLHMVLESLSVALDSTPLEVACVAEPTLTPLLLQAWSRHTDDSVVADCVSTVFESLCKIEACVSGLQQNALPALLQILVWEWSTECKRLEAHGFHTHLFRLFIFSLSLRNGNLA
jgi:hypothetical protein